ncbi:hypothetical protein [Verrucomicrobium spinosum]|uniref:hypothetical protein n=1 Tax=Verrucomicrobium spinosum TaxID=2736 RepID=UPI0009467CFA|nr:hypothetical protein [Verrucomicrobium spinosum]
MNGNNTLTGLLTLAGPGRINVDADTLTLQGATLATNVITVSSTSNTLNFGGAGTLVVNGRINSSTGTAFTKDGSGLMVVNGDNAYTTATAVSNGILRIGHVNALGTAAGTTTVSGTGAVELYGNGWTVAETFTLGSTGTNQSGGLRSTGGDNSYTAHHSQRHFPHPVTGRDSHPGCREWQRHHQRQLQHQPGAQLRRRRKHPGARCHLQAEHRHLLHHQGRQWHHDAARRQQL